MVEVTGDLWTYPADYRVITTNGTVKKNGECVMGRGCALEAKKQWPDLAERLGELILDAGNCCFVFDDLKLVSFPVKHNWWEKADPELIKQSAQFIDARFGSHWAKPIVVMPRPGCGNGGLKWEDVKPLLEFLPDNVKVISWD